MSSLYHRAAGLLLLMFCLGFTAGCHSDAAGSKSGSDDMNSAMSAQQKAAIKAHKQQDGQQ